MEFVTYDALFIAPLLQLSVVILAIPVRYGLRMMLGICCVCVCVCVQKKSREESSGSGSGVEILINEPYTDGPGGSGQYTQKIYHIGSHLPGA